MYKLLILALLGVSIKAEDRPMITEEMVEYLKAHANTWTPMEVSENPFNGFTVSELQSRLGGMSSKVPSDLPQFDRVHPNLAESFDGRQVWGSCVHDIRNQASCGSCWAFGSSEALSDRLCIYSDGAIDVVLSPQYQVSCDTKQLACGGGYLDSTWYFLRDHGTVLDSCMRYTSGDHGVVPKCPTKCEDGSALKFYKCEEVFESRGIDRIKTAIMDGPVEVQFHLYEDFYNYKSGIYTRTSLNYLGDHDVKVVGWGYDSTKDLHYWIAQNSWGRFWGENGFFRIAEGEVGFDDNAFSCIPDISGSNSIFQ